MSHVSYSQVVMNIAHHGNSALHSPDSHIWPIHKGQWLPAGFLSRQHLEGLYACCKSSIYSPPNMVKYSLCCQVAIVVRSVENQDSSTKWYSFIYRIVTYAQSVSNRQKLSSQIKQMERSSPWKYRSEAGLGTAATEPKSETRARTSRKIILGPMLSGPGMELHLPAYLGL